MVNCTETHRAIERGVLRRWIVPLSGGGDRRRCAAQRLCERVSSRPSPVATTSTGCIFGFLIARVPAFERDVHRESRRAGLIGVVAVLLLIPTDSVATVYLNRALSGVVGWCFVVAFLGGAYRFLGFSNAALRYLSESAFPIYILHQVGIVLVGYFVIQLSAGIAVTYAALLVSSVVATMTVYHCVVRPLPPLRFLLGMKPHAVRPVRVASGTAAALSASE
jgi:peptidoglycan/LPS O-acetylase OafA/YrhL